MKKLGVASALADLLCFRSSKRALSIMLTFYVPLFHFYMPVPTLIHRDRIIRDSCKEFVAYEDITLLIRYLAIKGKACALCEGFHIVCQQCSDKCSILI